MPKSQFVPLSIEEILALDREYRQKAEADELRKIAPKRFNPTGEAWLPIMHKRLRGYRITFLFSNTKRAHEQGKTRDWVVLYCKEPQAQETQCTIVTEFAGVLKGKRVIRGREEDCRKYYVYKEIHLNQLEFRK